MADIEKDIENNKVRNSCSIKIVDNKLSVNYCIDDRSKGMDGYVSYEKIFDDWQEFVDYCNDFFMEDFDFETDPKEETA